MKLTPTKNLTWHMFVHRWKLCLSAAGACYTLFAGDGCLSDTLFAGACCLSDRFLQVMVTCVTQCLQVLLIKMSQVSVWL